MKLKRNISAFLIIMIIFSSVILPSNDLRADSSVSDFVRQLYDVCLQRRPSSYEVDYWTSELSENKTTACSVAFDFIFSDEFQSNNYSNAQYITCMYKVFLVRDPDSTGLNFWVGKLNRGATREEIFAGFANSNEFDQFCTNRGMVTGVYISGANREQLTKVVLFVTRLYDMILCRHCDNSGMIYWCNELLAQRISGKDITVSFMNSPEFVNSNISNSECINRIYSVMLDRNCYYSESQYWTSLLDNGTSLGAVITGFASSPEFYVICLNSGINSGAPVTGWVTLSNGTFYYKNGSLFTGWLKENDNWYYVYGGVRKTGWLNLDGTWYFLDSSGIMQTGWLTYNSNEYYLESSGKMATGWKKIDGSWYYFDVNGKLLTGWQKIDNKWYYFYETRGYMCIDDIISYQGNSYYLGLDGVLKTGWFQYNSNWYYSDSTGKIYKSKWLEHNGYYYYFDSEGEMVTGYQTIGDKEYFFESNGRMVTNSWRIIDSLRGRWGYFGSNGARMSSGVAGWFDIDGYRYYFLSNSNEPVSGSMAIDGIYYYFDSYGRMCTGLAEYCYGYYNADGSAYVGWLAYEGNTYYCYNTGHFAIGYKLVDGNYYYFYSDGTLARGEEVYDSGTRNGVSGSFHYSCNDDGIATFLGFIPD